jgi:hypothetical protein
MAFIDEITARLIAQSVGAINVNIFKGSSSIIPSGNGPYLTVTDTGGSGASRTQNNTPTEHASAQVLVRASSYPLASTMIRLAFTALGGQSGLHNVTLSGIYYLSITAKQNPTDIGKDDAGRTMLVFNIDAEKQPS